MADNPTIADLIDTATVVQPEVSVSGCTLTSAGLFFCPREGAVPVKIAGPFTVVAQARTADGTGWSLLLRWQDRDGRVHEWVVPKSALVGDGLDVCRHLTDRGLFVATGPAGRGKFLDFLNAVEVEQTFRRATRTGWHEGSIFVLPDQAFGTSETVVFQAAGQAPEFSVRGTLEAWQGEVARYAVGNSRLMLSLCAALTPPLLNLVGEDSFGIHLVGPSSTGKTTALRAAASVWGWPVRTWRATDNGLETIAAGACDTLLCLDELSQADGRAADAAAYMLANGCGKARSTRSGTARPTLEWRMVFLSTGEQSLADKIAEVGRHPRAGQSVRAIEIPADAGQGLGVWEDLHGFTDGAALSSHLGQAARENVGTAARAFLQALVSEISLVGEEALRRQIAALQEDWLAANLPSGADGQVQRVARRFALIAAAGTLAIRLGVVAWPQGAPGDAALTCFRAWLEGRGGTEAAEEVQAIERVRGYLGRFGMSRFALLSTTGLPEYQRDPHDLAGWRIKSADGRWEYWIQLDVWNADVCKGLNPVHVAKYLADRGFLRRDSQGKMSCKKNVPGYGELRVRVITPDLLGEAVEVPL